MKLKRSKPFVESDIPKDEPKSKASRKNNMDYKYGALAGEGVSFMKRMQTLAAEEEPPIYAQQGADIGKTRGRKPKTSKKPATRGKTKKAKSGAGKSIKKKESAKGKRGSKKTKATKTKSAKSVVYAKFKRVRKGKAVRRNGAASSSSRAAASKPVEPAPVSPGSTLDSDMEPVNHGPRRIVPAHVTANHVYSSAYRKNSGKGTEYARKAAQLAAASFRESGFVDDLCGVFRSAPRRKNGESNVEENAE